jgi:hypothetical protein
MFVAQRRKLRFLAQTVEWLPLTAPSSSAEPSDGCAPRKCHKSSGALLCEVGLTLRILRLPDQAPETRTTGWTAKCSRPTVASVLRREIRRLRQLESYQRWYNPLLPNPSPGHYRRPGSEARADTNPTSRHPDLGPERFRKLRNFCCALHPAAAKSRLGILFLRSNATGVCGPPILYNGSNSDKAILLVR